MLKKTIKYTDFNDNERTEDFYFNLTQAEVTEMELSVEGGLSKSLIDIVNSKDSKKIVETFKELIIKSYGVKSSDGKRFVKNQQVIDEFVQSLAYSELFMELASNAESAAAFVNGILPTNPTKLTTPQ